jgi:hypothetical protein
MERRFATNKKVSVCQLLYRAHCYFFQLYFVSHWKATRVFWFFFFVPFISIHLTFILYWILGTYMIFVSHNAKQWPSHARVSHSRYWRARAHRYTRAKSFLFTCTFSNVYNCYSNSRIFKYLTVFSTVKNCNKLLL